MASSLLANRWARTCLRTPFAFTRTITTQTTGATQSHSAQTTSTSSDPAPYTHYKITLRRSAISLGERIKGTLSSLGIHRRMQTVYFEHNPINAGKILKIKELVEVENVPEHLVRTKQQQTQDRKAKRGYKVVGSRKPDFS